jgi:hypothetical protein
MLSADQFIRLINLPAKFLIASQISGGVFPAGADPDGERIDQSASVLDLR